jgi:hypothetical protein
LGEKRAGVVIDFGYQIFEVLELVLGQGFSREEIQRPAEGIAQKAINNWQVVAQRFSARSAGNNHEVIAGLRLFPGFYLVTVKPVDINVR